jgi:biotin carboxyl carrier protein
MVLHSSATALPPSVAPCAVDALLSALANHASAAESIRLTLEALLTQTGASRAALGWYEHGHVLLSTDIGQGSAPPSTTDISASMHMHADLIAAMEEAIDQGVSLRHPTYADRPADWVTRAHRQLAEQLPASIVTIPLPGSEAPLGAVLLCWHGDQPPPDHIDTELTAQLLPLTPLLVLQRQAARSWFWHLRQAFSANWQRWRHPNTTAGRRLRALLVTGAMALLLVPWPERVGGQARIEGASQRVLVSPTDGYIKATHVLPGDHVKAQQVLVDLAEQDLKLERDKWVSQMAQYDNAYAAAMAKADRSEAAISLSRLEEAQSQLALADEQLQRAQLKAPFDGVVIQGDLSQSIGAPVKQGDTLITVASTKAYRVIIDIDESDIARIHIGQEGVMALSALPWHTLGIKVQRITPQAQAKEGRNLYEVQASFTEALPEEVRPGLMGPAKVMIGYRPPLWGWLRPVVDRARLILWSWWG